MDNFEQNESEHNFINLENYTLSQHHHRARKIIAFGLIIVIILGLALFFYKLAHRPLSEKKKIDIYNELNSNPPDDGSVLLTNDEKLNILDTLAGERDPNAISISDEYVILPETMPVLDPERLNPVSNFPET